MKILLIGSLPPPLGGTTLTLDALREQLLASPGVELTVIDSGRIRGSGWRALAGLLSLFWRIVAKARHADVVSLHVATTAVPTVGLLTALLCCLLRRPLVLRKFASADYAAGNVLQRFGARSTMRLARVLLFETRALTTLSRERGYTQAFWFPTHRDRPLLPTRPLPPRARRFVFVGQIREYKGVSELLAAAQALRGGAIEIDFYGPLYAPFEPRSFVGSNVRYCGVLAPAQVMATIAEYDALILPTKAQSEGYPGVIVEALQVGVPVIASRCGAIAELVGDDCALLVPPGDIAALQQAIAALHADTALYARLRAGVAARAEGLSTQYWARQFVAICRGLAAGKAPDDATCVQSTPPGGDHGAC